MTRRLIADVDTGIDDALALAWLAHRDDVELVCVTTTAGNTTALDAAINSVDVLRVSAESRGRELTTPVLPGSEAPLKVAGVTTPETHGDHGIGYHRLRPELAAGLADGPWLDHWLDALRGAPGEVDVLVTGPCTNLALALRAEPQLPWLARSVTIMGGSFDHPGNTTPSAEWNCWVDPHATAEVYAAFESAVAAGLSEDRLPRLCALQATEAIELRPSWLDQWAVARGHRPPLLTVDSPRSSDASRTGDGLFDLLANALRFYFEFHADYGYGYLAHVHDLSAAMVAIEAIRAPTTACWVGVETSSALTRGTTVRDSRGLWGKAANARVVTSLEVDEVLGRALADLSVRSGAGSGAGAQA